MEFICERLDRGIWNAKYASNALTQFEQHPEILNNDVFKDQFKFVSSEINEAMASSQDFRSKAQNAYGDYSGLSGAISQSTMNMSTGVVGIHQAFTEYKNLNPNIPINLPDPYDNPYRKEENLINKLSLIDSILTKNINDISQSISILTTFKHLKNTANLMREFISDFLQKCDPYNKVKNKKWVKLSLLKKPTQASRTIYVIIGSSSDGMDITQINQYIVKIANDYRDLYRNLNPLAYNREGKFSIKNKLLLKNYYTRLLDLTETILDLRKLHFTN